MNEVLVAYGTGHPRTGEIALVVGEQFTRAGLHVDVRPCHRAQPPDRYGALVLGCALDGHGRWEPSVLRHLGAWDVPPPYRVHLFDWSPQSRAAATADPVLDDLRGRSGLRSPVTLPAPLGSWDVADRCSPWSQRSVGEDLRRWQDIRRWAAELATALAGQLATVG